MEGFWEVINQAGRVLGWCSGIGDPHEVFIVLAKFDGAAGARWIQHGSYGKWPY